MLELKIKLGGGHDSSSLFELAGLVVGCTSIPQRYSYSHKGLSYLWQWRGHPFGL